MTFNSRSLRNKTIGVTEFLTEHMCDTCCVTEAWLKMKDTSIIAEIKDLGYKVLFQPRKGKRGGGVCTLYKDDLDVKKCNVKSYKSFELLEVIIKGENELLWVSTFYRTGKMSTKDRGVFIDELDDYLQSLSQKKGEKLVCGDFNIHVQDEHNLDRNALYFTTESYGFCQVVDQPTQKHGATLDLVFAQGESKCFPLLKDTLLVYDLCFSLTSDHSFIEFHVPFNKEVIPSKNIELSYRDFQSVDVKAFCEDVIDFINVACVDFYAEEPDSAANIFHDSIAEAIDKHAPVINASVKPKKTPFSNNDITVLRRKRRKAERNFRKYRNINDEAQYHSLVKGVRKLVNNTRNEFYQSELASCKGNKKDTFKVFNKLLGNDKEHKLPTYENEMDLCNDFEQYFHNKIQNIRNNITKDYTANKSTEEIHHFQCTSSFDSFRLLTDYEIIDIISNLPNKQCKLDPVSFKFFKECLPYLLQYVKHLINTSLHKGTFPTRYKEALVKPKLKENSLDQDVLGNYRPLSNLSFLSKILERCALMQLVDHLESNNLFGAFQSAYRKFHSCETAITKISNDILSTLDNKQCSFLLFLDLSAAFDTIDHSILLSILHEKYNVNNMVLQWFQSYLKNRSCKVNIGKSFSEGLMLLFGVPQGSILGPILFILYISDIEYIAKCHGFRIHVYADDTQLYIAFEKCNILSTISDIEQCLREIKCWMSHNFLKINEDKTKLLMISSKEVLSNVYTDLCISFSGNIIIPSLNAVNLGVNFDSTMSMETYINNIVSKGYCKLNNFWKTADKLTYDLKLQLVASYILPLIDYCNITFTAASKLFVNKLQKLLNSAIRFIFNLTGKRYRFPITPYMKKLHILPVHYRIKYKISLTVYKCLHDLAPAYLQELIVPRITYSHLRSSNDFYSLETIVPNSKYGESSFSYIAPITWNELPKNVKLSPTINCFKSSLKSHYFTAYFGDN